MTKDSSQRISTGPDDPFQMKILGEHPGFAKHALGEQITTMGFNLDGENHEKHGISHSYLSSVIFSTI